MITPVSFIDIHTHKATILANGKLSIYNWIPNKLTDAPPKAIYSLGIHPWYIQSDWPEYLSKLERLLQIDPALMAIGETGLDSLCNTPLKLQETVFIAHLKLAEHYKKPLIIHCVKAHDHLLDIVKSHQPKIPLIVHGFNQKWAIAERLLAMGLYLSFGKSLEHEKSNATACIRRMAIDGSFFLETDDQPIEINQVHTFAAQRLCVEEVKLSAAIQERFNKVFNYSKTNP